MNRDEKLVGAAGVVVIISAVTAGAYYNKEEPIPEIQSLTSTYTAPARLYLNKKQIKKLTCKQGTRNRVWCWSTAL